MLNNLEVINIDNNTWRISEGIGKGRTHCYLLEGDNKAVIIDTGLHVFNLKEIVESLTKKEEVYVVNTHGHLDHITNNFQFNTLYLHPKEDLVYREHSGYKFRYLFFSKRYIDKGFPKWLIHIPSIQEEIKKQSTIPTNLSYKFLYDGMKINLGNRELVIIETPGHTYGSVCILDVNKRRIYTGDTVCGEGVLLHFKHSSSIEVFISSIKKLKNIGHLYSDIYAGHQRIPLDKSILNDYITCAKLILENKYKPVETISAVDETYRFRYKDIAIVYAKKE